MEDSGNVLLYMELTIVLDGQSHPLLESVRNNGAAAVESAQSLIGIRTAMAAVSPDERVSADSVAILDASVVSATSVVAWVSVPVQNTGDADPWMTVPPPEVRQRLQEAGIAGVVWAGLSNQKIPDELIDDAARMEVPAVAFAVALGCSIGVLAGCAALDKARSSTGCCCMGRREAPVHSELLFPLVAASSVALSVWYTVYYLAESPSLFIASVLCLGSSVIFNACSASLYIVRSDMMMRPGADQKRYFSSNHDACLESAGPRDRCRQSKWALCITAVLAAFANVGSLKLLICDAGDWCCLSSSNPKHMRRLSALGLVAALLGDLSHIIIVMMHSGELNDVTGHQWTAPVVASVVLSGNVVLFSLVASLRNFMCTHSYPMKTQSSLGSQHSALLNISLSRENSTPLDSPSSSPPMAVAESCVMVTDEELVRKELRRGDDKPGGCSSCH